MTSSIQFSIRNGVPALDRAATARQAGAMQDEAATTVSVAATATNTMGSSGSVPKSTVESRLLQRRSPVCPDQAE